MPSGVVKWFSQEKGYGFIKPDVPGPDIFVHMSEVKKSGLQFLEAEEIVYFELEKSAKTGKYGAVKLTLK